MALLRHGRWVALPLGLVLALAGCRRAATDPILLRLGGQEVRRSEFERHVREVEARGGASVDPAVRTALLEPFLEERVLVLEARRVGLVKPAADAELEQAAVRTLLQQRVLSGVAVEDAEIAGYFAAHAEEFKIPETLTLRQILLASAEEAEEVRRRTLREPKSFDLVARSRSRSPEASTGGLMGTFHRGELPTELETAAFALPAGGTSEVVTTTLGYHVLKVEARQAARERSLDECRAEIRALLVRNKSDAAVRTFVEGLMAGAKVNHEAAGSSPRHS